MTFRATLILSMCGVVVLAGAMIIVVADRSGRSGTRVLVDSLFREVSGHAVTQTGDFVGRAAPVAESLQRLARQGLALDEPDRLAHQLGAFLEGNPGMTQILYADETGEYTGTWRERDGRLRVRRAHIDGGRTRQTEYEVGADGSWTVLKRSDDEGYDPRTRPFYLLARDKGRLAWTPPYMFFTQGVPGVSCVIPLNDAGGRLRGVFSVEFDLNALSEFVSALSVSEHSRVVLFMPDQTLLAYANQRDLRARGIKGQGALLTLADTGDPVIEAFRQHLRPEFLGEASASGTKRDTFHFFEFDHDGVGYMASTTVFPVGEGQSWIVGAVAPRADFLAAVWRTRWLALGAAAGALALAVVLAALLAGRVSRPVQSLIGFMRRVGDGDLDSKASFGGSREFRELSAALNRMIGDLRDRLRLRHSLDVAMDVQQQLLPRHPPVVPGCDIAGHSTYCDETGGDYYDFLVVDEPRRGKVLIALGDVMGHGVAAALVMAGTRAVLRDRADATGGLGAMLGRLNRMIATDLAGSRFMTMHLGMMDVGRRVYTWASAGHDPPMVFDPATGTFDEPEGGSLPLGVTDETTYEEQSLGPLSPGQVLVLGTDGIWEMPDAAGQLFGKQRLREVVRRAASGSAEEISRAIRAALTAFRGQEKSTDDVTFVIVKAAALPPVGGPEGASADGPGPGVAAGDGA